MPADEGVTPFPPKAVLDLMSNSHAIREAEAASQAARERWRDLVLRFPKTSQEPGKREAEEAAAREERLKADLRLAELLRAAMRRRRIPEELERELIAKLEAVRTSLEEAGNKLP